MYIFKAAVVGAGAMGGGIAQVITFSGLPVVLKDVDQKMLDKGMETVREIYQARVDKGKMSAGDMQSKLDLVTATLTYDGFEDVDIVIEAVPEIMKIKQRVFAELDEVCPEATIFASNTSALSISEMAAATKRPHKVIGMHFFNPAHVMKLVEIIPGLSTSQETVDDVLMFTESLRKLPVVVQECPGFLVNRLLMPYLNEATLCLQEGAATAAEIDTAAREFGWPMGPFQLMDMLGLDICYHTGEYLYQEYGERMKGAELFEELFKAGRLGEKTNAGFYGYGGQSDEPVKDMIAQLQADGQVQAGTGFNMDRLMMPMINEASMCLLENVARPNDIDMAMIAGTGMTKGGERMGPLALADEMGLDVVVEKLQALQAQHGERFRPSRLLKTKVRAGHLGKKTGRGFLEYS
ncbi:MAG: 3-hydroxyacyl-CoA dehydrogenase [Chloroflexi bacterium]|nr:3-hydroxyacyl-CoA dehydrogenase [Chloroflexota bacterium]MBU1748602.1 3-hydroxyacyl-CoA dehydrogenase [Chloroflexota bacterium]